MGLIRIAAVTVVIVTGTVALSGCPRYVRDFRQTSGNYPAILPASQTAQAGNLVLPSGVMPLKPAGNAVQGTMGE